MKAITEQKKDSIATRIVALLSEENRGWGYQMKSLVTMDIPGFSGVV